MSQSTESKKGNQRKQTAKVRGKVGLRSSAIQKKLEKGSKYLNSLKESPLAAELKPKADILQTALDDLTGKHGNWKAAHGCMVRIQQELLSSKVPSRSQ